MHLFWLRNIFVATFSTEGQSQTILARKPNRKIILMEILCELGEVGSEATTHGTAPLNASFSLVLFPINLLTDTQENTKAFAIYEQIIQQ